MKTENLMLNSHDAVLNIGKIVRQSNVIGPGKRFVIWLQGCSLQCKGCINKKFWSKEPNRLIPVSNLVNMILNTPEIEGVTYTGGEPFEQAEGLYSLSTLLKDKGLSIMSYTGYTYKELSNSDDKFKIFLLSCLDILIDGRYECGKSAPLLWRGSGNQKVYFLSSLYRYYEELVDEYKLQMAFSLEPGTSRISIEGNFSDEILAEIKKRMKVYGINL